MRTPTENRGWIDRTALALHHAYRRLWVRLFVGPLLLAMPPVMVTAFFSNAYFRSQVTALTPDLAKVLGGNVVIWVVCAAAYPTLILAIARFILHRADGNALTAFWLTRLNAAIDRVVGCKAKRFEDCAATTGGQLPVATAFCLITQPGTQIGELVRGICEFFNAVGPANEDRLIRVILAEMENGKIKEIPFQFPEDERVRTPMPVLNDSRSTLQTALRTGEIVVIQSIAAEMKKKRGEQRYASAGNEADDNGSLICFPIIYTKTGEIPFIVSIHCDEDGYFKDAKKGVYQHTLERFSLRIQLEYSLMLLKEGICERSES
jgi:hypothetical protein